MDKGRILDKYAALWGLSDFKQVDYRSVNYIFTCVSPKYGLCVLKIGGKPKYVENEYYALKEYNGRGFCKVYETDATNGVLLLEHIVPGMRLRAEPDLDRRLDVFYELSRGLHIKPADERIYPTYMSWVSDITKYMSGRKDHRLLYGKMARAEEICRDLWEKYPEKMLLHGDLHQDNILLGENDRYRIIDPKGVVGNRVFDIPRFILNEFYGDIEINDSSYENFAYIAKILSGKFRIPEQDIRRLFYVEVCMAYCWTVSSGGEPKIYKVLFAEKMMDEAFL